jgi:hydroxyacylglutathione hydrolase
VPRKNIFSNRRRSAEAPRNFLMSVVQHTIETPYQVGPVHCYSAELAGELVLFDTGPPTELARDYLRQHLDLSRLRHVVCTHCHIDHYGLVAWLEEEYGARIYLPYRDALKIELHLERLSALGELLVQLGFSRDYVEGYRSMMDDGTVFPRFPRQLEIVEESDLPTRLGFEVLPCPGHSQSDLVYATDEWAITGDVLLDGIFQSPLLDVDLETGHKFNNYQAYCQTLDNLGRLRGLQICPGHRESIPSVESVILFYVGKLLERTARIQDELYRGNLAEIVIRLFGGKDLGTFLLFLKASEIAFMQEFLADPQRLKGALEKLGLFEPLVEDFARVTR